VLRTGVLGGRTIALAGVDEGVRAALETLGATTFGLSADGVLPLRSPSAPEGPAPRVDTLVADTRGAFESAGRGYPGLRAAVDGAFAMARDVAVEHWIDQPGGGQVVLLAPAPGAGAHAQAARAALDNLVRTLSTEWARHEVTTVAVLAGDATSESTIAELVAWLVSPAGAYLSGTALTLDRPL